MSWLSHCLSDHPNTGGLEYTALVTGLNLALVGWENFTKKIKDTETLLQAMVEAGCASIQDADTAFLKWICRLIVSERLKWFRGWFWVINYALAIAASFIGLAMLYFGIQSRATIFLLLPLIFFFLMSWGPAVLSLGIIKLITWFSPKVASSIRQMRQEEAKITERAKQAKGQLLLPQTGSGPVRERKVYQEKRDRP